MDILSASLCEACHLINVIFGSCPAVMPLSLSMIWQVGNVFCILCFQSWGSNNTFFILEGKRVPSFEIILPNTVDSLPGHRQFVPAKVVWLSPTWPYLSTSPSWPRWLWSVSCRCKAICQECQRKRTRPEKTWGGGSEFGEALCTLSWWMQTWAGLQTHIVRHPSHLVSFPGLPWDFLTGLILCRSVFELIASYVSEGWLATAGCHLSRCQRLSFAGWPGVLESCAEWCQSNLPGQRSIVRTGGL